MTRRAGRRALAALGRAAGTGRYAPDRASAIAGVTWAIILANFCPGCGSGPAVTNCTDNLTGVWLADERARSGERLRFHLVDHGERVDIMPMFDDSHPPTGDKAASEVAYAPASFAIRRFKTSLVGERSYRVERRGIICTVTDEASIRSCERNTLELSWVDTAHIDWRTCTATSHTSFTRVRLVRQR